jgi:hypothetical protein
LTVGDQAPNVLPRQAEALCQNQQNRRAETLTPAPDKAQFAAFINTVRADMNPSLKDHDFAIYDLRLKFSGGSKDNDLLQEISAAETYVIDNNVPWKRIASDFPSSKFVLGATVDHESNDLHGVLFNRGTTAEFRNVFALGLEPTGAGVHFVIHRLDKSFVSCFKGRLPQLGDLSEEEIAPFNCPTRRDELRHRIFAHMQNGCGALNSEIESLLPLCRNNFAASCTASELIYALFLLSLGRAESEKEGKKFRTNHPNLFGDTRLIQEALMLGARIVTSDVRDVFTMARIAGVIAKRPEQFADR